LPISETISVDFDFVSYPRFFQFSPLCYLSISTPRDMITGGLKKVFLRIIVSFLPPATLSRDMLSPCIRALLGSKCCLPRYLTFEIAFPTRTLESKILPKMSQHKPRRRGHGSRVQLTTPKISAHYLSIITRELNPNVPKSCHSTKILGVIIMIS
jgi:hypothetical protein